MKNYVVLYFGEYTIGIDLTDKKKKRRTIFCRTLGIRMNKINAERKIVTFYNKNHKSIEQCKGYIWLFGMDNDEKIIKISPFDVKQSSTSIEKKFYTKYEKIMTFHLTPMKMLIPYLN